MSLFSIIKDSYMLLQKCYRMTLINHAYAEYKNYIEKRGGKIERLSKQEKKAVDDVYKKYGFRYSYRTHELCKTVTGVFDPYIMPEDLFRRTIEYVLNNQDMRAGWSDKNYFERLLPNTPFPQTIVHNICGTFYDENYRIITDKEAIELIKEHERVVIKPSIDTGCGKSVKLITDNSYVDTVFDEYGKDFIVQKCIKQHVFFSQLNKSSVQVIRYITLFLDNKVIPLSATVRIGTEGNFTDVSSTEDGKGFFVCGIDASGRMRERAYCQNGEYTTTINGQKISEMTVPNFDIITKTVVEAHETMRHFGFVGWDVTLNEEGYPIVIEHNVKGPGVLYYQYTNGPLLGSHTTNVMEYVKSKI